MSPQNERVIKPGVYGLFVNNATDLPMIPVGDNGLIYIGMTADKTGA